MNTRQVGALVASLLAFSLFACEGSRLGAPGAGGDVSRDTTEDVTGDDVPSDTLGDATDVVQADGTPLDVGPDVVMPVPEWEAVPLGDLGDVGGLMVLSAHEAYAASGTRVLRYNGTSWASFGSPKVETAVHAVWSDGVTLIAVGDGGLIARRTIADGVWTLDDSGSDLDLHAIAGRSATDLTVVGDMAIVLRATGAGWVKKHDRNGLRLRGVWMDPETEGDAGIYAVGSNGQLVSESGGTWRGVQIAASASTLSAFAKLSDGTLLAVGTAHTVTAKRPNSPAWQGETTNDTRERDIHALTVGADGVVRAFGAEGLVMKREGLTWAVDSGPGAIVGVKSFSAAGTFGTGAAAGIIAIAKAGGGIAYRNGAWASLSTALDANVTGLAEGTDGRLWASAGGGVVMVRVDGDWSVVPLPFQTNLNAIAADGSGGAWAVGAEGRVIHITADLAVEAVPVSVPVEFFGVTVHQGKAFVCGRGGTFFGIERLLGQWVITARATSTVADLRDVLVDDAGDLWVVGAFGTLLNGAVSGGAFVPVATGTGGSLHDIALGGAGLFAVGDNGVVLKIDGDNVTLEQELPGVFLFGVGVGETAVIAAGSGGRILRRDPGSPATWTAEQPSSPSATFESVLVDSTGQAWVGSNRRDASLERRLELFEAGE